jgi:WD40 repeat protein
VGIWLVLLVHQPNFRYLCCTRTKSGKIKMRYFAIFFIAALSLLLNACQTEDGVPTYWGEPRRLKWSPDGKTLAVCSTSGIFLFDAAALNATPRYLSAICDRMIFSPDSKLIAIPFDAEPPGIGLWNAETQRFIIAFGWVRLPGCLDVYSDLDTVVFSPDSRYIAASGSCGIEIWDINSRARTDLLHEMVNIW